MVSREGGIDLSSMSRQLLASGGEPLANTFPMALHSHDTMHHHLVLCIILACLVLFSQSFVQLRTKNHATSQALFRKSRLFAKKDFSPPKPSNEDESSVAEQGLTYTVEMSKTAGISWGTDISFRWVYVFDLEPQGEAAGTKLINKGDYIIGVGNSSLIAQDFDYVLTVRESSNTERVQSFLLSFSSNPHPRPYHSSRKH